MPDATPPLGSSSRVSTAFYYEAKAKQGTAPSIYLTDDEEAARRNDYMEVKGMKQHHSDQHASWQKAGNFYNIIQSGQGSDDISRYAVGLSRTIIDSSISMMNEGSPEGAFRPLVPSDRKISILWDALAKHYLSKCNWSAHQRLWTTDLHIFGSSPLEAYVNPIYRRPNEEPGLFLIRLATQARVGLRHRSIWYSFRSANVSDPDAVPACAWEETVQRGLWVTKYAPRPDFKNVDQLPVATKYKLTHLANEYENTYRIYALPFGTMAEAAWQPQPPSDELGIPVYEGKLTDLNPLGMCPMSFGIFGDQLTPDYKQHSLYGMGIPQLIEGMEMIMEGLFNMTVDNMRLKNTVPVGYQPYTGQTDYPDVDNMILESGRVYNGTFQPQSLGMADITSNQAIWEWINNLCIWLTGCNFQQLGGDTSKTAFEFAQRLKANNQRAYSRIKGLEQGPLRRSWMMLLANGLSQIKQDEWEEVTEVQAQDFAKILDDGDGSVDDYKFENGQIKSRKFVEYFTIPDYQVKENFAKSKKRKLDTRSTDNTLELTPKKGESSMVPAAGAYLFPRGDVAQMIAFTCEVDGKQMIGDSTVKDQDAINNALTQGAQLMPLVPNLTPDLMFNLWKQGAEDAGLDVEAAMDGDGKESELLKKLKQAKDQIQNPPSPPPNAMAQSPLAKPQAPAQGSPAFAQPANPAQTAPVAGASMPLGRP